MKSRNQMIESIVSNSIRQSVSKCMEPGVIMHVMEDAINKAFADILNDVFKRQTTELLQRQPHQRVPDSVQRNGYKDVHIAGIFGGLTLKRPVVRKGSLVQPLLGLLRKGGRDMIASLASAFWMKGTSTRNTALILRESMGARLSASEISRLTNNLAPILKELEDRRIPEDIEYLFLDALYLPVHWRKTEGQGRGFTAKQALLCAIGIDSKAQTHVLGFLLGERETLESWEGLLDVLLQKGLDPTRLKLVISDEHKAIISAVEKRLGTPHQYCVFHKMRNIRLRIPSPDRKAFMEDFRKIYWASTRDEAVRMAGMLQGRWGDRYPKAVELTLANLDHFLMFMKEPKERWRGLRTSNRIERFNEELRRRLRPAGTIHSELELSKIFWAVSVAQEKSWRMRKAFRATKEAADNQAA